MRGTLSLPQPEPGWRNLFRNASFRIVKIDGVETFLLNYTSNIFGRNASYSLFDTSEKILKVWQLSFSCKGIEIIISESPSLKFVHNLSPKPGRFITPTTEISAALKLNSSTRILEIEDMQFKHKDYESVIHFRCPDEKIHQTIIIADLLFSPPIQNRD